MYHSFERISSKEKQKSNIRTFFPRNYSEEEIAILRELAQDRLSSLQPEDDDKSDPENDNQ